ncbi:phosphate ABC transporter substrate-binding protein PstS [Saxibacter everestensis]|uniref:Phosphate-binding protein n=1 Tax=Saxibacter everestensis TaxID=2909229 RepID=A0ABY8QUL2_9MICO|nr:phosphate ABC transporter substrate-binding protein PstS [Brevibacteriaceae bacterium ZFBP1038]
MKLHRFGPAIAIATAGALLLSACGSDDPTGSGNAGAGSEGGAELSGTLQGIGSSAQKSAMDAWIAGFQGIASGATVQYSPDGSGAGREQFLAGAANFAGSDAALDDDELTAAKEVCGPEGAYEFPVYVSPIAVAYNLPGVDDLQLAPETIAGIFSGKITSWNDEKIAKDNPDAKLPDTKITPVHRSDESGTTENFTDYLAVAAKDAWGQEPAQEFPKDFGGEAAQGTTGVIQTVEGAEGAIGYADDSAVSDKLGTAKVKVGDEYVELSAEAASAVVDASPRVEGRGEHDLAIEVARDTTESGAYPIVLVSYHIVCSSYKDQETVDLVKEWEKYVVSEDGQKEAQASAGSAPISDDLRADIEKALEAITVAK